MKDIDLYIQEKLTLNPDSKISKIPDIDLDKLTDDICDHLLVLRPNYFDENSCKKVIKTWLEENEVKEIEYWTTPFWKDQIENTPLKYKRKNIKLRDYKSNENIDRMTGKIKQSYGIHKGSLYITEKCIYISINELIFCFKK